MLSTDKVTDCVVPATKVEEFIASVFHNGLALGWEPFSVNRLMLLSVFLAARQNSIKVETLRSLQLSQTVVMFQVWLYHLHILHCAGRQENGGKKEDWVIC